MDGPVPSRLLCWLCTGACWVLASTPLLAQEVRLDQTPSLEIGDVSGSSDPHSFTEIQDIAVRGDSILVIEGLTNEIRVFDHSAKFQGFLGARGEGPGEHQWPVRVRVRNDGIEVVDLDLWRRTFYGLDGHFRGAEPLPRPGNVRLSDYIPLGDGIALGETAIFMSSEEGFHPERTVLRIDSRSGVIDTIASYTSGRTPFRTADGFGFLQESLGSAGAWDLSGDSLLAIAAGHPTELRWWRVGPDGLTGLGRVELPFRPEAVTGGDSRDLIARENNRLLAAGGTALPRSARLGLPTHWGQVKALVISDDGHCWIQWDRPRTDRDGPWFIVDLSTGEVSTAELPPHLRVLEIAGGRLYGYVTTDYDIPIVQVYQILGRETR